VRELAGGDNIPQIDQIKAKVEGFLLELGLKDPSLEEAPPELRDTLSELKERFMRMLTFLEVTEYFRSHRDQGLLKQRLMEVLAWMLEARSVALYLFKGTNVIETDFVWGEHADKLKSRSFAHGKGVIGRAAASGEGILCTGSELDASENQLDGMPVGSIIAVPLRMNDKVLGVVEAIKGPAPGKPPFGSEDLHLAQAFANMLAIFILNTQLSEQVTRYAQQLDRKDFNLYTLYQVSKALSSILDLEELMRLTCDMLSEVMTVGSAVLFLTSEEGDTLDVKAAKYLDPSTPMPDCQLVVGDHLVDWINSIKGEAVSITDFNEPKFSAAFPEAASILASMDMKVVTPLIHKYKLVGLVVLGAKFIGEPFQERDFEFLSTLAPLAANAISNAQLYELAILDGTTRLFMARYFRQRCQEEIKRARRYGKPLSLIMFDIDFFKRVNDTHGHLTGDRVLREVAAIIKRCCRQDVDIAARYGGEEFVVLSPETPREGAVVLAERVRKTVQESIFAGGIIRNLTISGGIASLPTDADTYSDLVEKADVQLYRAKRTGRNKICTGEAEKSAAGETAAPLLERRLSATELLRRRESGEH